MVGRKKQELPSRTAGAASSAASGAEQELTHADILRASARIDPELRRRSERLWDDRAQSTRGPKAAQTPDDVIQAAVRIADEKGLSALTMHALAAQLGFTTMAVYRYFPSRDALYDAIVDAGLARPPRHASPRVAAR